MSNRVASAICGFTLLLGSAFSVNAETVNFSFSNADTGNSIYYQFNHEGIRFIADGIEFIEWNYTFEAAVSNFDGITTIYDSSNYTLRLGDRYRQTTFEIFDLDFNAVSQMEFYGNIFFEDGGGFYVNPYGGVTPAEYTGSNIEFFWDGETPLLSEFNSNAGAMTSVSMTAVSAVPVPAAVWLLGSGLIGLAGIARRKV